MSKYDIIIIGAGPAGSFAAYEINKLHPEKKVLMLDAGNTISKRHCPIQGKNALCIKCKSCDVMYGFGGAGAFSDGKFNFTTAFGGWLNDYMSDDNVMDLIEYVDSINVAFGATEERFSTYTKEAKLLDRKALEHDLHLLQASVKHLGTEKNLEILKRQFEYLNSRIEIKTSASVKKIINAKNRYEIVLEDDEILSCDYLIAAPGRSGAEWFSSQCKELGINMINNQVDIGVRIEVPARVFEHITDVVYEAKLVFRTKQYGDLVRTFCMNPYGHVVSENVDNCITVNGHSFSDESLRSENTNFALLVSNRFTEPFNEPYQYGKRIASLSNMLGGGVLVQRFGDLIKGDRKSTRLNSSHT